VSEIAANLARVRERIADAALRVGRRPDEVRLVAVSKTFPVERLREAFAAGQREFGENKVQEALQKMEAGADMQIGWHLVGHLQSNKAKKAAGRVVDVLVQVDLALEPTKHGAPLDEMPAILQSASTLTGGARLRGLMLLPPLVDDPERARPWFRQLREARDRWMAAGVPAESLQELSMGMSHDFEVAVEEGATMVRVGSAIFGTRGYAPAGAERNTNP
jgi:uncharacterized pyridoxal phosphate-containing UPF0001 family protein